jgi:putative nucleotidyltransferase with HDIG domain
MTKTILVVDDMAIFREPIEAVLRADGFQVLTASNGVEALAAISRQRPDLVLLDLGMPVMDGLAALKKMREDTVSKRTAVIVLSAETDRARIVDAVKLGISGYLLKSQFSLKDMLERVKKALEVPQAGGAGAVTATAAALAAEPTGTRASAEMSGPEAQRPPAVAAKNSSRQNTPQDHEPLNPDTDLKSLRPLMTRSELLERVTAEGELTGFSPTVSQVLKITASEKCSMEQVAKAVSQDHAIALKVLKLANSSVYSRGDRVDTVHKAVLRIGMQSIRQAVLNIGVVERFGSLAFEQHLSTPLFWEHSIACGIIAAELAHALKHKEPDIAFTAGLLHDLGRVIYAERLGEQYVHVLEAARAMQSPLEEVESRLLLMSHAEVMDKILHAWRFPKDLVSPIVFHHAPPGDVKSLAPHQAADVLRLGLADRLAHAMMLGSSGNDTIYPTEEHCRLLGVEAAAVRSIEDTARQKTDDTKFALLSHSSGAPWARQVEVHRAALGVPFRPLYVSASPEIDAYRIFCAELAEPVGEDPPNLAVVHIAAPKERAGMPDRLAGAEREAGVSALPVLVLSPGGQLHLEDKATAGRQCQTLSTPTPISRFIAAVSALIAVGAARTAA